MTNKFTLTVQGLDYNINGRNLLKQLSFDLPANSSSLILGSSGSGKTTLLSILGGLQRPDAGEVMYGDTSLYNLSESARDKFRGLNIAILFQRFHLLKAFSVQQNILMASFMSGQKADMQHINSILERLQLADKLHQRATDLSVGEAQRLALARAIAVKPKWLLCDEPTSSLDDNNTEIMLSLLEQEAKKLNISLIIVTHDARVKKTLKISLFF